MGLVPPPPPLGTWGRPRQNGPGGGLRQGGTAQSQTAAYPGSMKGIRPRTKIGDDIKPYSIVLYACKRNEMELLSV